MVEVEFATCQIHYLQTNSLKTSLEIEQSLASQEFCSKGLVRVWKSAFKCLKFIRKQNKLPGCTLYLCVVLQVG